MEEETKNTIEQYEAQLAQIESLLALESNKELETLKKDLVEAIEIMKSQSNELNDGIDVVTNDESKEELIDYNQLIGCNYLVPFILNGKIEMHEAEIIKIVEIDKDDDDAKLEVKFLYPLNESMKYCSSCENNSNCSFNHGYSVKLSMIRDTHDSDDLQINSVCLFKEKKEEYWKKGQIVDKGSDFVVRKELTQELINVDIENVCAFNDREFSEEEVIIIEDDELKIEDEVVFLKLIKNKRKNNLNDHKFSDIEIDLTDDLNSELSDEPSISDKVDNQALQQTYSNSIGLKLLKKLGYELGTGLGKNRDGIVSPIHLTINPKNTSLDTVMELKEKGYLLNSSEKFSYEKQKNYFKNLILKKNLKKLKRKDEKNDSSKLFDTLNQSLSTKSILKEPKSIYSKLKLIQSETKNVDNLNLDIFNVEKEIEMLKNDILYVRKSIDLCREMNPSTLKKLNNKLNLKENELHTNELKLKALKEKKKRKEYDHNIKYF